MANGKEERGIMGLSQCYLCNGSHYSDVHRQPYILHNHNEILTNELYFLLPQIPPVIPLLFKYNQLFFISPFSIANFLGQSRVV